MMNLRRAIRFDKLGVNDAVLRVDTAWSQKRLVGREQFLPLLDRIAKNETFVNLARDQAATPNKKTWGCWQAACCWKRAAVE